MKLRKINIKRLISCGVIYRIIVILFNTLFFASLSLDDINPFLAAILWNSINMSMYFIYHSIFLKLFKMGKD